jgi:hypothetical protein
MTFCPATACPLFARDGSPWTGHKARPCPQKPAYVDGQPTDYTGCGFFNETSSRCDGCGGARHQVEEAAQGKAVLQIGPAIAKRGPSAPRSYDCAHAADCQWRAESGDDLCPPRYALSKGLDPRLAAY